MKALLLILFALSLSSCSTFIGYKEAKVRENIKKVDALVIVHPTGYFDKSGEAKAAINDIADIFLRYNKEVYTLVETTEIANSLTLKNRSDAAQMYLDYFPKINQSKLVISENGENNLKITGKNIVVVGGYLLACLRTALKHLSQSNLEEDKPLNIYIPLRAIYGKEIAKSNRPKSIKNLKRRIFSFVPAGVAIDVFRDNKKVISLREGEKRKINLYFRAPRIKHFPQEKF